MATYYVGPTSAGAANGTSWANRLGTLNGAEDLPLSAGDTVYVGPGTYRESLTVDVAGSSGSPITYIGDYTGANTDGVGGMVRITGSDNDQTATRASCIVLSNTDDYRTFQGFTFDLTTSFAVSNVSGDHCIIEDCTFQGGPQFAQMSGTATNCTIRRCFAWTTSAAGGNTILFSDLGAGDQSDTGHVVENCIIIAGNATRGIYATSVGGVTVRNCVIASATQGVSSDSQAAGQTVNVNNCVISGCATGLNGGATGHITEDYNALFGNGTARTNTSTGSNSNAYPMLADVRWFMEATLGGGTLVTPFDLASYSALVELNSGTGAPSADLRGTTVQGTYREWGPLEYDSTLDIEAGAGGGGGPVIGSRVIQGLGAI